MRKCKTITKNDGTVVKLTKENTLRLCREMWQIMQTGSACKSTAIRQMQFPKIKHDCFCCEAVDSAANAVGCNCDQCALLSYWNGPLSQKCCYCQTPNSPWQKWRTNFDNKEVQKEAAIQIIKDCETELCRMHKKVQYK